MDMYKRGYTPKFCEDCGTKVKWGRKRQISFDVETGKKLFIQYLICPAKKWWQLGHIGPLKERGLHYKIRFLKYSKGK